MMIIAGKVPGSSECTQPTSQSPSMDSSVPGLPVVKDVPVVAPDRHVIDPPAIACPKRIRVTPKRYEPETGQWF